MGILCLIKKLETLGFNLDLVHRIVVMAGMGGLTMLPFSFLLENKLSKTLLKVLTTRTKKAYLKRREGGRGR